jgi:hypothetical protein
MRTKTSNNTYNLLLFSLKEKQKNIALLTHFFLFFCAHFLFFSHAPCENFFRPRADSTVNVTDSSLFCHARLGEGKGNFQFPLPSWRKKSLA